MLTPDKLKEKSFQTTGRGSYRAEDVDSFLSEVSASYEQMFKENGDLIKKISILAKKVEEYRADEESLKMALLNAQKLADKITAEAKEESDKVLENAKAEAEKITSDAKAEADATVENAKAEAEKVIKDANRQSNEILGNINRKVTHESLVYDMIQKEAAEFKSKLVAMYKEHINLINQLPEIVDEKLDGASEEAEVAVQEPIAEETAAEETAVEEISEIVEEPATETVETVEDVVEETTEDADIEENTIEEIEEAEPLEETPAPKKPFKLDLSKIDFADDIDEEENVEASTVEEIETVEDSEEDDDDDNDTPSISFKNFFKKK